MDEFVARLKPEAPLGLRERPLARRTNPSTPFSHLGLPEPDLLARVREGQVCAPCEDNLNWLKVAVVQVDDRTSRVHLSASTEHRPVSGRHARPPHGVSDVMAQGVEDFRGRRGEAVRVRLSAHRRLPRGSAVSMDSLAS
ncbi:hypothetical protein PUR28_10080 [Streptomyces sp. BE308]|uniref:hypothetical protein n=1 Tax=Streptomyces sp. BE308 TaxID=3002529 RepID=UPI002E7AA3F3|nr:hypothetical protein [Streptomyces sp. BE308]MEE1791112.1 hypothetical protein [Streptomyces sp. BE308]